MATPGETLIAVHYRIRRGDWDTDLLRIVREYADTWRTLPNEVDVLKAENVAAEVLDYFGCYDEAAERLRQTGPREYEALERSTNTARLSLTPVLIAQEFKRRLWVALAYATSRYRFERYDTASEVLSTCHAALERIDPSSLLGTRARLAYSFGQLARQQHDYGKARRHFEEAAILSRQRFVNKTPYAELDDLGPRPEFSGAEKQRFEDDSLMAELAIGQCLALGLGLMAYTTGNLASANMLLSAGYTLLRRTGDQMHRAYAQLLLGAVERAQAHDGDLAALHEAVRKMRDATRGLEAHRTFSLRARLELALAQYRLPLDRRAAAEELRALRQTITETTDRGARMRSIAFGIESRIERLEKNTERAIALARSAIREARAATEGRRAGSEVLAEARIAMGEALLDEGIRLAAQGEVSPAQDARARAFQEFKTALREASTNPKLVAVCHLQMARTHLEDGNPIDAQRELAAAPEIEHGAVQTLAEQVRRSVEHHGNFYLDKHLAGLSLTENTEKLEAFLIREAESRKSRRAEVAELIGRDVRQLYAIRKRLVERKLLEPRGRRRT